MAWIASPEMTQIHATESTRVTPSTCCPRVGPGTRCFGSAEFATSAGPDDSLCMVGFGGSSTVAVYAFRDDMTFLKTGLG